MNVAPGKLRFRSNFEYSYLSRRQINSNKSPPDDQSRVLGYIAGTIRGCSWEVLGLLYYNRGFSPKLNRKPRALNASSTRHAEKAIKTIEEGKPV